MYPVKIFREISQPTSNPGIPSVTVGGMGGVQPAAVILTQPHPVFKTPKPANRALILSDKQCLAYPESDLRLQIWKEKASLVLYFTTEECLKINTRTLLSVFDFKPSIQSRTFSNKLIFQTLVEGCHCNLNIQN